jgi:hypothetical protein
VNVYVRIFSNIYMLSSRCSCNIFTLALARLVVIKQGSWLRGPQGSKVGELNYVEDHRRLRVKVDQSREYYNKKQSGRVRLLQDGESLSSGNGLLAHSARDIIGTECGGQPNKRVIVMFTMLSVLYYRLLIAFLTCPSCLCIPSLLVHLLPNRCN